MAAEVIQGQTNLRSPYFCRGGGLRVGELAMKALQAPAYSWPSCTLWQRVETEQGQARRENAASKPPLCWLCVTCHMPMALASRATSLLWGIRPSEAGLLLADGAILCPGCRVRATAPWSASASAEEEAHTRCGELIAALCQSPWGIGC